MLSNTLKTVLMASCMAALATGCATTTPSQTEDPSIIVVVGPNGELTAVDQDGNEVKDDPMADLLLALSGSLQAQELEDDEIWSVSAEGDLTHIQSGGICPLQWGEFTLNKPTIFKRDGSDVSCNYVSQSLDSAYTFYMYRNDEDITAELAGVMQVIQSRNPTAKSADFNIIGPKNDSYYVADTVESENASGVRTRDGVMLTESKGWRLKLRMTYPAEFAVEREHLAAIMLRGQMDEVGNPVTDPAERDADEGPKIST